MSIAKALIIIGLILVAAGLAWPVLSKLGLFRLPGDMVIAREGFRFYFPVATALLLSLVASLVLWLITR